MIGAHLLARTSGHDGGIPIVKHSYSWNFNTNAKPVGMLEDAPRTEMMPFLTGSNRLLEKSATGGYANGLYWFARHPDLMGTLKYRATVTVGNASASTNRGVLVWVGGTDGAGGDGHTNGVWLLMHGQGGFKAKIGTKVGLDGTMVNTTRQESTGNHAATANETIALEISQDGGIYTYTAYENGVAIPGLAWTDTAAVAGTPGHAWGCGGLGAYSGGYFPSLSVYAMACEDL